MLGNSEHQGDTGRAEEAITGARFVKQGAAEKGILMADAGELALGVSKFDIASGDAGLYYKDGDVQVEAGETIAVGERVASGADGVAMQATSDDYVLGICKVGGDATELLVVNLLRGAGIEP